MTPPAKGLAYDALRTWSIPPRKPPQVEAFDANVLGFASIDIHYPMTTMRTESLLC